MAFIRVRDAKTRHQIDVPEQDWRINAGLFEVVKSDPDPVVRTRPAKYHVPQKAVTQNAPTGAAKKEVADNG